jgi:glycine/D-amino acid oxidase-like deaminating enzyme
MADVVIVGGGFAGVWSAAGAALARGEADLPSTAEERTQAAPAAARGNVKEDAR